MEYPDDVVTAVAERALSHWDVGPAKLTLISRTENVVFRVDGEDGARHALRVHRPGYHTLDELESEPLWTSALHAAGIGAPVAEKTREGGHYAVVEVPGTDELRHVGLIPWFDGAPLDEMIAGAPDPASRNSYLEQLGRLMGAMHGQAVGWSVPAGFARHAFDAEGLMGESPFWGRFWEIPELSADQRRLLGEVRNMLRTRLADYGRERGTFSMIHADLRSANILVDDDRVFVIDFDDAGFGWHQYDMATTLFDYITDPDLEDIHDALITGYRTVRHISDEDVALIPQFTLARMLASLGWLHDRPEVELYPLMPVLIGLACSRAEAFLDA